ncbi:hypothetical protein MG293_002203 [Ovis ammon polii]|uniref:Uncharacterized protein n=1 Tax=Ovis ammon polii TaxID=230172 RepID=A0AAD4UMC3_OVIAM|nr:hypothetical protein MG293_002203 [Ovis ammon polii]
MEKQQLHSSSSVPLESVSFPPCSEAGADLVSNFINMKDPTSNQKHFMQHCFAKATRTSGNFQVPCQSGGKRDLLGQVRNRHRHSEESTPLLYNVRSLATMPPIAGEVGVAQPERLLGLELSK